MDGEIHLMGIISDAVSQVVDLSASDILPVPPFGAAIKVDFLQGLDTAQNKFFLILDIDKALTATDLDLDQLAEHPSQPERREYSSRV